MLSSPSPLFLEGPMILVSATQNVSDEIKDFLFGEHHEEIWRHHGNLARFDTFDRFAVNIHALVGITQVGVNGDIVSAEIHDHSAESFAILSRDDDRCELFINLLAWVDDLIEQVVRAVATPGSGQIRPGHSTGIAEAVTGIASRSGEHRLPSRKIASLHAILRSFTEIFQLPHRRRATIEHFTGEFDGALTHRLPGDEFSVLFFLSFSEGRERIITDKLDKLSEARSAVVVRCFEEPFELLLSESTRPTGFQKTQATGVFHLWFLTRSCHDESHPFGCRIGML